ncbi:lytic transglycosylase domain-containing protein [Burkholderia cepacia]|nr:lytic transglycosylase domain-containing protein [Burkholderia cepacia]
MGGEPPVVPPNFPVLACVVQAAHQNDIPLALLLAIGKQEGGRVGMRKPNTDGSTDNGPMQINNRAWGARLSTYGITMDMVADDPCVNVHTAAFILRTEINSAGGNVWFGVGHYHSRTPWRANQYMQLVWKRYQPIVEELERLGYRD